MNLILLINLLKKTMNVCKNINLISSVNLSKILVMEMELSLNAINVAKLENLLREYIIVHSVNMMCIKNV